MNKRHVFISYKVEDFGEADHVRATLEDNGFPCWMAPMSLPGGSSYAVEIPTAIKEAACVVLILSRKAQLSKWVSREVDRAINENKRILPFVIEDCPLTPEFQFYLTNVQRYAAYENREQAMLALLKDVADTHHIDRSDFVVTSPRRTRNIKPLIAGIAAAAVAALGIGGWLLLSGDETVPVDPTAPIVDTTVPTASVDVIVSEPVITTVDEFSITAVAAADTVGVADVWNPAVLTTLNTTEEWTLLRGESLIDGTSLHLAFRNDNAAVVTAITGLTDDNYADGLRLAEGVFSAIYNAHLPTLPDAVDSHDMFPVEKIVPPVCEMETIGFGNVITDTTDATVALKHKTLQITKATAVDCQIRTIMKNGIISYDLIFVHHHREAAANAMTIAGGNILHNTADQGAT